LKLSPRRRQAMQHLALLPPALTPVSRYLSLSFSRSLALSLSRSLVLSLSRSLAISLYPIAGRAAAASHL
jgi:hypothetical protein